MSLPTRSGCFCKAPGHPASVARTQLFRWVWRQLGPMYTLTGWPVTVVGQHLFLPAEWHRSTFSLPTCSSSEKKDESESRNTVEVNVLSMEPGTNKWSSFGFSCLGATSHDSIRAWINSGWWSQLVPHPFTTTGVLPCKEFWDSRLGGKGSISRLLVFLVPVKLLVCHSFSPGFLCPSLLAFFSHIFLAFTYREK